MNVFLISEYNETDLSAAYDTIEAAKAAAEARIRVDIRDGVYGRNVPHDVPLTWRPARGEQNVIGFPDTIHGVFYEWSPTTTYVTEVPVRSASDGQ